MLYICWNRVELFYQIVIYKLQQTFSVGRKKNCDFKYIGLNVKSSKHLDQFNHIEQLKKIQIDSAHKFM